MGHSVFQFSDAIEYLRAVFHEKRKRNPRFSLRAWARQLGIDNPASLSRIFQGKRPLGPDLAIKIAKHLEISPSERRRFLLLAVAGSDENDADLNREKPAGSEGDNQDLTQDQFRMISEWHHFAILEMTGLKDFNEKPAWVSRRLGGRISPAACADALSRLIRLGMIAKTRQGEVRRTTHSTFHIRSEGSSLALREFHRQAILKALDAVEGQRKETRMLTTSTIGIRTEDIQQAQRIITRAHAKLTALAKSAETDAVYQLSTQFFRLTDPKEEHI